MKFTTTPSKSNASISPNHDSIRKWKIPHYSKKPVAPQLMISGLKSSGNGIISPYNPTMAISNGNRVNIMSTPRQIQLEDPDKPKYKKGVKSKARKNGEMVFVNFTVEDTAETIKKKKYSKKDAVLRILTGKSSRSQSPSKEGKLHSLSGYISAPSLSIKSSCESFVKRERFNNNNCSSACTDTLPNPYIQPLDDAISRSNSLPNSTRTTLSRSVNSNVALINNNGRCSLRAVPVVTDQVQKVDKIDLLKRKFSQSILSLCETDNVISQMHNSNSQINTRDDPKIDVFNDNSIYNLNTQSKESTLYIGEVESKDTDISNKFEHQLNKAVSSTTDSKLDENDASIAFSKLFSRKRANTGGSMSSLVSSPASLSHLPTLHRNLSTNSISSASQRYSPNRSNSPARNRSNTKSSQHRLSRNLSFIYQYSNVLPSSSMDTYENISTGETYLDTQARQRYLHKKKHDSISDFSKLQSPLLTVSNTIPPAASSAISSVSSSSTPNIIDSSGHNKTLGMRNRPVSLESENSLENESFDCSSNDLSSIKGIPIITLEEGEEYNTNSAINSSFNCSLLPASNPYLTPAPNRNSPSMLYQYTNNNGYTLINTGLGSKDVDIGKYKSNFALDLDKRGNIDTFADLSIELGFENPESLYSNDNSTIHNHNNANSAIQGDISTIGSLINISPMPLPSTGIATTLQEDCSNERTLSNNMLLNDRSAEGIDEITDAFSFLDQDNEVGSSYW